MNRNTSRPSAAIDRMNRNTVKTTEHVYKMLRFSVIYNVFIALAITTHLVYIDCADRPKLQDMFNARDVKTWQRKLPVGFPDRVCALNLLFINIFHDVVVRNESRCVILRWKNSTGTEALVVFPRKIERINKTCFTTEPWFMRCFTKH